MEENNNIPVNYGGMSKETDELLRKYLKMEIAARTWSMVFRVIMLLLVGFSVVLSVTMIPKLIEQLGNFGGMYNVMDSKATGVLDTNSLNELIKGMSQVKGAMDVNESSESAR